MFLHFHKHSCEWERTTATIRQCTGGAERRVGVVSRPLEPQSSSRDIPAHSGTALLRRRRDVVVVVKDVARVVAALDIGKSREVRAVRGSNSARVVVVEVVDVAAA